MIKQPSMVRDRVMSDVVHMVKHLYSMLTLLPMTEVDVLRALDGERGDALIVDLTNRVMAHCGHDAAPSQPRFDKTRRKLKKKKLRGANTFDSPQERKRLQVAPRGCLIPTVMET